MFDYVIVGGGSAGSVLAGRLSEDPSVTVCLIEAGGPDKSAFIHAPLGFAATASVGIFSWGYETVPQAGFNGRKGFQPRGKVMGGCSSINAMVYTRGNPADYNSWANLGNPGWSYQDVLPIFKKAENNECFGATEYRGVGGPLNVAYLRSPSPINDAFIAACEQSGIPKNPDYNAARQFGVSPAQVTQKNGERYSAAKAYVTPNLNRKNLTVITRALTTRILTKNKVATGVEYKHEGTLRQAMAKREVLVCGGAFNSPQILMLSGIGPAAELKRHGIAVVHELPGVGQNLHDHLSTVIIYRSKRADATLGLSLRGGRDMLKAIFEWREKRTGWVTSSVAETQGFISTENNPDYPNIQLALCIGIVDDHIRKQHLGHGYTLHVTLMRPKSRGSLTLNSANPEDKPAIDIGFLSDPRDLETLSKATQMSYDILQTNAMDAYRGDMLHELDRNDQTKVEQFVRKNSDTEYHPVGTCKMGPASDPMAVVDATLRVHGMTGLRVVDASVMPQITTGNTNAPTIMIAEKAAMMIREGYAG